MRILVTDRSRGKTTKLLQEAFKVAKDAPTVVLCFNNQAAKILRREFATKLVGSKLEIFGLQEFMLVDRMRGYKHIYFDDVDQILFSLVHQSLDPKGAIRLATATGLPVHDLKLIKEAGAQLWREAGIMLRQGWGDQWDDEAPAEVKHIADEFKRRALSLEDTKEGHHEVRDSSSQGTEAGSIQPADPSVHEGKL